MRRRITSTMVGVVAASLLVAMLGTALLVRRQARADTAADLRRQATAIAQRLEDVQRPQVLAALNVALRLDDLRVVCFGAACRPGPVGTGELPAGLSRDDVDLDRLRAGETVSGRRGTLAFATAGARTEARPGSGEALLVVVLTRRVDASLPGGLWFVGVAALTLAVAAAAAADLARRLTRPLREAQAATRRIAAGDLTARVPVVGPAESTRGEADELAALGRSINTMAASLERSRGLERQFLLSVSHDLRTPLTSVRGYAEALAEGRATDPAHAAEVILSEARRLERLVGDLLELARLDARRFGLDLRATDVAEVVADTAEGFRPAAEAAGVALAVHAPASAERASADPDRLAQVVANLVENALKYASSAIEVGCDGRRLWVADDGPGIDPDDLAHVFEPFWRSARPETRPVGTGLGLAIVHELVEAMGGEVAAAASPAGGTQVTVTLRPWA